MLVFPIVCAEWNIYQGPIFGRIREFVGWLLLSQTMYPSATLTLSEDYVLPFAAHDVQFMTTAIDNSIPAPKPGLNEHMVRLNHTESRNIASK